MTKIVLFIKIVLIGVGSCLIFDIWQRVFQKITAIPPSDWGEAGRWCIGLFREFRLFMDDTNSSKAYPNEVVAGWLLHYVVAIFYVIVFEIVTSSGFLEPSIISGFIFGAISVIIPWFFFLPCLGKGIMGSRTRNPILVCFLTLKMHSLFGASIGVGYTFFEIYDQY